MVNIENFSKFEDICNFEIGYGFYIGPKQFYGTVSERERYSQDGDLFYDRESLKNSAQMEMDERSLLFMNLNIRKSYDLRKYNLNKVVRTRPDKPYDNKAIKTVKVPTGKDGAKLKGQDKTLWENYVAQYHKVDSSSVNESNEQKVIDMIEKTFDGDVTVIPFIPQQMAMPIVVTPNVNRLIDLTFNIALVLQSKGISATEKVDVGGNLYGQLFLVHVMMLIDLFYALDNRITIFQEMPDWYWGIRGSLLNQQIDGFVYSWDTSHLGDIKKYIDALQMTLPSDGNISIAPINKSVLTPDGQYTLDTTFPPFIVDDLLAYGPDIVGNVFMQSNAGYKLVNAFERKLIRTAAAFAQVDFQGTDVYNSYGFAVIEVPVLAKHLRYAEMRIAIADKSRVGKETYSCMMGPVVLMNLIYENIPNVSGHYRVVPVPVSYTSLLANLVAIFLARDVMVPGTNLHGVYTQKPDSWFLCVSPGIFFQWVALLIARYRINNTWLATTPLPQNRQRLVPPGSTTWFPTDNMSFNFPQEIIENLAKMVATSVLLNTSKSGANYNEIRVPYLYLDGFKTNANPMDNSLISPNNSVLSIFKLIFPLLVTNVYDFGSVGGFPNTMDFSNINVAFFYGPGPNQARTTVAMQVNIACQNFTVCSWASNINKFDTTLNYYNRLLQGDPVDQGGFDRVMQSIVRYVGNNYAFDPNAVSGSLVRILPMMILEQLDEYDLTANNLSLLAGFAAISGIRVVMDADDRVVINILLQAFSSAHNIFNESANETARSDDALIEQHDGGGFISTALLAVLDAAPHVIDAGTKIFGHFAKKGKGKKARLSGKNAKEFSAISGLDRIPDSLCKSGGNPYNPLFRLAPKRGHVEYNMKTKMVGHKRK